MAKKRKEFNLKAYLKNAIRRASYRHPARAQALNRHRIAAPPDWPNKRVRFVYQCQACKQYFEQKQVQCDHIFSIVPLTGWPDAPKSELYRWVPGLPDWNPIIYRTFVDPDQMQPLCRPCHKDKTKHESTLRRGSKTT